MEPTESEDLGELDRFCEAMIAIRAEVEKVGSAAAGGLPARDRSRGRGLRRHRAQRAGQASRGERNGDRGRGEHRPGHRD
ncbi:hypothetical protein ABZS96_40925 [Streptomyces avermitilis]